MQAPDPMPITTEKAISTWLSMITSHGFPSDIMVTLICIFSDEYNDSSISVVVDPTSKTGIVIPAPSVPSFSTKLLPG
jgi:hypothetical protein